MMTDAEANANGIDNRAVVRQGLIELRDQKLKEANWDETLLLSHAIWWLSTDSDDLPVISS